MAESTETNPLSSQNLSTPTIASLNAQVATPEPEASQAPWLNATLAAQIAEKIKANSLNGETDDLTSFETKKKVDDVKQKVYVFGLAIIAYFLYTSASAAFTKYNGSTAVIADLNWQIAAKQTEIDTFKSNAETLKMITRESDMNNLTNCINNSNLCDKVLTGVKKNLQVTRSYLLITPLSVNKMEIDQKSLLKYFNEYLLVSENKATGQKTSLGQLLNITFTSPSLIDQNKQIYQIGVDTTITFPSKDAMMELVAKVETWLNPENPLLIKINTLNYDIVKFEEAQTVNVSFVIYQYKK